MLCVLFNHFKCMEIREYINGNMTVYLCNICSYSEQYNLSERDNTGRFKKNDTFSYVY
jgi:hypothetical protein